MLIVEAGFHDLEYLSFKYGHGFLIKFKCPYCSAPNSKKEWNKSKGEFYHSCDDCGQEFRMEKLLKNN